MAVAGLTSLTKLKYNKFVDYLKEEITDEAQREKILTKFCEFMNFDPTMKSNTPEQLKKQQEKRDALKKEGITTWISSGMKKSYEKKKLAKQVIE